MSLVFLFPGQGSQYPGMGKSFYDNSDEAKDIYKKANDILGFDVAALSFEGSVEELKRTSNTQPALFVASYCGATLLKGRGITPSVCAGHSLGEYSALAVAGYLSFEDGLIAVRERGKLMESAKEGTMAAIIGLDDDVVESICEKVNGIVECVNYNSNGQVVISGEVAAVEEAMKLCKEGGAKIAKRLEVSGAFHSSLMKEVADEFAKVLEKVSITPTDIDVVSNVSANFHEKDESKIKELLIKQLYSPVKWKQSMKMLIDMGYTNYLEVGASKVLKGLMARIDKAAKVSVIDKYDDITSLEI